VRAPAKLYLASSNPGKLNEFRALAHGTNPSATHPSNPSAADPSGISAARPATGSAGIPAAFDPIVELAHNFDLDLAPWFHSLPEFEENAPTFAENALGKALHYSRNHDGFVFADDSGLVVPALGGAPGVKSARYAGPNATSAERNAKLLTELRGKTGPQRVAYFVCAIALVQHGQAVAVVTARADGQILEAPQGQGGFGYDPVFYVPELAKTFADLSPTEKNTHSHRGKAFRRMLALIASQPQEYPRVQSI
jgi:XTP/dITP diphosphohydrolase